MIRVLLALAVLLGLGASAFAQSTTSTSTSSTSSTTVTTTTSTTVTSTTSTSSSTTSSSSTSSSSTSTTTSTTVPTPAFNETVQCGTVQACLTTATACAAVRTSKLDHKTVHIDATAGTLALNVECQVAPGDTWIPVASGTGISADTILQVDVFCTQMRMRPTTCTGCNYTATLCGVPYGGVRGG